MRNITIKVCRLSALLILSLGMNSCQSQSADKTGKPVAESSLIKWTGFEEAVVKNETEPKKVFIDVYTDWCGWCKRMDATTFKNDTVVNYLNENFHAVKLNAEGKDTIRFRDQMFVYRPEFKANEIALALLGGKMGYPSFVILDENFSMLNVISGYHTPELLMQELRLLSEGEPAQPVKVQPK
ncbi:MAG: DUF255 domain-containing protein [Bacteroidia bacterium]|nr:DUF255 domain-containing protein [Bacteroidia bacterium]MCZ2277077.1 DUF255 domain-containing protein [Bacteroidia bacterium]